MKLTDDRPNKNNCKVGEIIGIIFYVIVVVVVVDVVVVADFG